MNALNFKGSLWDPVPSQFNPSLGPSHLGKDTRTQSRVGKGSLFGGWSLSSATICSKEARTFLVDLPLRPHCAPAAPCCHEATKQFD